MPTTSAEHQRTFRGSKVKRLTDAILCIPPMSQKSFERWSEARDTYVGQAAPRLPQLRRKVRMMRRQRTIADEQASSISMELTDQSIQADLSRSLSELTSLADSELASTDSHRVECSDKATATDENIIVRERTTSPSIHFRRCETPKISRKTSISSTVFVREQFNGYSIEACCFLERGNIAFRRIRHRFKRLSRQRRLLFCLLLVYGVILCALLVIICLLLWMFHRKSRILSIAGIMLSVNSRRITSHLS